MQKNRILTAIFTILFATAVLAPATAHAEGTATAQTSKKGGKGKGKKPAPPPPPADTSPPSSAATSGSTASDKAGDAAAGSAAAAGKTADTGAAPSTADAESGDGKGADGAASATKNAVESTLPADDPNSPFEKPNTTYQFVGARFRYVIIPKFMMHLFGDGGTTVGIPAFGPEFSVRRNGFEYTFSLMYAIYNMDPTPFKAKTDPDTSYEIVDANLKALYLSSDFMWSADFDPKLSFVYGAGAGLGIVFGDIHRVQAYPPAGVTDPYQYQPCVRPGVPNGAYCGNDNDHYGNFTEPSWANGGSKPIVFPWLSLNTGLRFKPSRHAVIRLDVGWNLFNGPFFGLAGNYGL